MLKPASIDIPRRDHTKGATMRLDQCKVCINPKDNIGTKRTTTILQQLPDNVYFIIFINLHITHEVKPNPANPYTTTT